jgi:hypothetical protein
MICSPSPPPALALAHGLVPTQARSSQPQHADGRAVPDLVREECLLLTKERRKMGGGATRCPSVIRAVGGGGERVRAPCSPLGRSSSAGSAPPRAMAGRDRSPATPACRSRPPLAVSALSWWAAGVAAAEEDVVVVVGRGWRRGRQGEREEGGGVGRWVGFVGCGWTMLQFP